MITCNCGGNCSDLDVKPMVSKITISRYRWKPRRSKTCLSNVLSPAVPYGTSFASLSALNSEKSWKKHMYQHAYAHAYVPEASPNFERGARDGKLGV